VACLKYYHKICLEELNKTQPTSFRITDLRTEMRDRNFGTGIKTRWFPNTSQTHYRHANLFRT